MTIEFTEASGLNDSIYGKCQTPIRMFIEHAGEQVEKESMLKHVFSMGTSENFADTFTGMTAMDGFKPVGESGAYPRDGMRESFKKTLIYDTWKDSFAISKEIIEDSKMMDLRKQPQNFMIGYKREREKFGAALYGSALKQEKEIRINGRPFDITCNDGKPLFAKDHQSILDEKYKQCNVFSDEFSADALGEMETRMQNFCGDAGELLEVNPTTILIPNDASLKKAVFAAIGADKNPVNSDNAFNYIYGRWRIVIWNYLNAYVKKGKKPWILLDPEFSETYGGAVWNDRVQLEIRSALDDNTDANVWYGRSRFNAGFNNWRFAAAGGIEGGEQLVPA